ncbi:ER lumen protein retaining receptor [Cryptosporidium felis]|nr:ER lumen protein retaining receptor [Cryptosporidium felis]
MQDKPLLHNFAYLLDLINLATAISWLLAYIALFIKISRERNIFGLSLQTLLALVVAECNHVLITIVLSSHFNVNLGIDFYFCDCLTAIISIATFIYIINNYYETYERNRDNFGLNISNQIIRLISCYYPNEEAKGINKYHYISQKYHWLVIYLLNFFFGTTIFLFRKSSIPPLVSVWESYMDSLLTIALLPQVFMFYNKRPRKVSSLLAHFVVFILLARSLMLLYWILYPLFREIVIPGRRLHIFSESLNVLFLSQFLFYFIKSKLLGEKSIFLPM